MFRQFLPIIFLAYLQAIIVFPTVISTHIGEGGAPIIGLNTVGITIIFGIDGPIMVDQDLTVIGITQVGMTVIVISLVGIEVVGLSEDLIEVGDLDLSQDLIRGGDLELSEGLIEVVDLSENLVKNVEVIMGTNDKLKVLQE